jgi:hypothetical protein
MTKYLYIFILLFAITTFNPEIIQASSNHTYLGPAHKKLSETLKKDVIKKKEKKSKNSITKKEEKKNRTDIFKFDKKENKKNNIDNKNKKLKLSVTEAIYSAISNNSALNIEKLNPLLLETYIQKELSAFDRNYAASLNERHNLVQQYFWSTGTIKENKTTSRKLEMESSQLYKSGNSFKTELDFDRESSQLFNYQYSTRLGVNWVKPLKKGRGADVNLASLKISKLNLLKSKYELKAFAETLAYNIENLYWDIVLLNIQKKIYKTSLNLSKG